MQIEESSLGIWKRFGLDLAASRNAMLSAPAVPLVTGVLAAVAGLIGIANRPGGYVILQLLYVALLIFWSGWVGVERIFFLQRFRGENLKLSRAPALALRFIPRYLLLLLILVVPFVVLLSVQFMSFTSRSFGSETPILFRAAWFNVVQFLLASVLVVLMTFVTPALAYTTKSTFRGVGVGVRFLRDRWSQCKLYALFPILIWLFVFSLNGAVVSFGLLARLGAGLVSVYLILLMKGAAARFYIDEVGHEISSEGAALVSAEDAGVGPGERAVIPTFGWLKYLGLGLLAVGLGIALLWPVTVEIHETSEFGFVSGTVRCGGPVRTLIFGPRSGQPGFRQLLDGTQSIESYRRVKGECSRRALAPLFTGIAIAAVGGVLYLSFRSGNGKSLPQRFESNETAQ